ncbi:MAG: hypothetical protein OEU32_17730, partial [Acidimicrobiia bacterium]|nr:hypothetical protein [Acidimicrobiia bacterium]
MRRVLAACAAIVLVAATVVGAPARAQELTDGGGEVAEAEQNESPAGLGSVLSGRLALGTAHTCAILDDGNVRCWGLNSAGQLGYGNTNSIGDNESAATAGPVDLGPGRTATAITAGFDHTCAVLDNGSVRCWGAGGSGQLGYGNTNSIGDNETPGSVGPVDLGPGRTATAVAAGTSSTCAILDNGDVRCWGANGNGDLGYGNITAIGDNESPASAGPVDLGPGRTATAIAKGSFHTCALLDNLSVRCWGTGADGRLGYNNTATIGDNETPNTVGPVNLGRPAIAITAGGAHTCALLDNSTVLCWGGNLFGQLGYGNTNSIGDNESPASGGAVNLGAARTTKSLSAGSAHTCAAFDDGTVGCWGLNSAGQLGYGNVVTIGDNETPASAGAVQVGSGRTATVVSLGDSHSCAILDTGAVRCWGSGADGRLGLANTTNIGDNESPGSVPAVDLAGGVSLPPRVPTALAISTPTADEGSTVTVSFDEPTVTVYDSPIASYTVTVAGRATVFVAATGPIRSAAVRSLTVDGVDRSIPQSVNVKVTTAGGQSRSASTVAPALRSRIFVSNTIASGPADYHFVFAGPGDTVVTGDWTGDGNTGFASRAGNLFTLVDERGNPRGTASFGKADDEIFIGDWNANGTDTFGVRRGNVFFLRNTPTSGNADVVLGYGKAGDETFVGDWDGNGQDTFAVRRGNVFFVRNSTTTGIADVVLGYGKAGDEVLVGDWDQDGTDTFAVRRGNTIFIRNDFQTGIAEQ